ncbi:MAG: phage gp6-like head-tail connector protein [Cellulosilyticum sp.]|nr:phage gp6-like head-tail connector protein [Cellulosilyticum sp.]
MKVSDITTSDLADYLKIDQSEAPNLQVFLDSAKAYIKSYTGLDDEAVDSHPDLVPVIYVLVVDAYDNREYTVKNGNVNKVVQSTLNMYSTNLL